VIDRRSVEVLTAHWSIFYSMVVTVGVVRPARAAVRPQTSLGPFSSWAFAKENHDTGQEV